MEVWRSDDRHEPNGKRSCGSVPRCSTSEHRGLVDDGTVPRRGSYRSQKIKNIFKVVLIFFLFMLNDMIEFLIFI